jgi:transposase-like protein
MTQIAKNWTEELIAEAVAMYLERMEALPEEKRAEQTVEITAGIAEELGFKTNSVRVQLSKAKRQDGTDVYIRKSKPKAASTTTATAGTGAKRVSKADAQAELTDALKKLGAEVNEELEDIISKLTGKAAQTLAATLNNIEE